MVVPMLSLQENHITIIYLLGKTWENHIIIIYLLETILHWFCLCFKIYLLVIDIGGSTMPLRLVPFTATGGAVEYHGIGAAARVCSPQGRVAWPKTHRELPRWPIGDESKPQKKHFVSKLWMKIHWSAILMFAMGQGELTHGQVIHLSDSWDFSLSLSNMDRHKHGAMRLNYEAAEMVQNALYAEKIEVPCEGPVWKALCSQLGFGLDRCGFGEADVVRMSKIWGSTGSVPVDLLFRKQYFRTNHDQAHFPRKVGWNQKQLSSDTLPRHICPHLQSHRGWTVR